MKTAKTYIVATQVRENYGAHDWDGTGECPQYWKFKGGNDYRVQAESLEAAMQMVQQKHGRKDNYYEEYVIDGQPQADFDAALATLDQEAREFFKGRIIEVAA
jgi:hypothetical protein